MHAVTKAQGLLVSALVLWSGCQALCQAPMMPLTWFESTTDPGFLAFSSQSPVLQAQDLCFLECKAWATLHGNYLGCLLKSRFLGLLQTESFEFLGPGHVLSASTLVTDMLPRE